ncbi:hypothetical protein BDP27DRAFT_1417509 [Rhodocollybia butyracea]|uniref:Aminoglycoside phosphotransferase domain-containing protein n=1 Tax=Rhodocollybia butyracea TaxID=206335 RepID=A0A9P5Q3R3_9AGAR|nr:hypothetical protein BDP27DRAFT_1417509 [Rhodocollybia butyracea]
MAEILDQLLGVAELTRKDTDILNPSPSDAWSDAEVIERLKTAPALPDAIFTVGVRSYCNVHDLCADTVVKRNICESTLPAAQARVLAFVHEHTSIPVPRVRRCVNDELGLQHYILMEKIPGKRLDRASAVYKRRHAPGPMSNKPERCEGIWPLFPLRPAGPFKTSRELVASLDKSEKHTIDYTEPMALTHGDISMRNVIVGDDGKLWLVDWEWSAFYPLCFEYIATMGAAMLERAPDSWKKHIPIVTDGASVKELDAIWEKR